MLPIVGVASERVCYQPRHPIDFLLRNKEIMNINSTSSCRHFAFDGVLPGPLIDHVNLNITYFLFLFYLGNSRVEGVIN